MNSVLSLAQNIFYWTIYILYLTKNRKANLFQRKYNLNSNNIFLTVGKQSSFYTKVFSYIRM